MNQDQLKVIELRYDLEGKFPHPGPLDTWVFLVTEIGEVGDAMLRLGYGELEYLRNSQKDPDIKHELGDVMLMLCTLANHFNIDLSEAVRERIDHFRGKYDIAELYGTAKDT